MPYHPTQLCLVADRRTQRHVASIAQGNDRLLGRQRRGEGRAGSRSRNRHLSLTRYRDRWGVTEFVTVAPTTLVLATVDQAGKLVTLKAVRLGAAIAENAWYRVSMDVTVDGDP